MSNQYNTAGITVVQLTDWIAALDHALNWPPDAYGFFEPDVTRISLADKLRCIGKPAKVARITDVFGLEL